MRGCVPFTITFIHTCILKPIGLSDPESLLTSHQHAYIVNRVTTTYQIYKTFVTHVKVSTLPFYAEL